MRPCLKKRNTNKKLKRKEKSSWRAKEIWKQHPWTTGLHTSHVLTQEHTQRGSSLQSLPYYPHTYVFTFPLKCFTCWTFPYTQTKCSMEPLPMAFIPFVLDTSAKGWFMWSGKSLAARDFIPPPRPDTILYFSVVFSGSISLMSCSSLMLLLAHFGVALLAVGTATVTLNQH